MASEVKYSQLYTAATSRVLLCETEYGSCVLKRWLEDRVRIGGNRAQPLAEYAAMLDLHDVPNINAPLKITLDKQGVDFIYVHCGQNALQWRVQLEQRHADDDPDLKEAKVEQLVQHVAVHVLLALQEMSARGLVHRDVKPTNILLRDLAGWTWLSDMGLTTRAQEQSGFVKGFDLSYIPPEYIQQQQQQQKKSSPSQASSSADSYATGGSSGSSRFVILQDLTALAEVTTTAADMYQLGLTLYQLITCSLPPSLTPAKAVQTNPKKLSDLLQRIADFNWHRELQRHIANPEIRVFLEALLCNNPRLRPSPQAALECFDWLKPAVQPALLMLEQQRLAWPQLQQQALLASKHMELLQLQEECRTAVPRATAPAAAVAPGSLRSPPAAARPGLGLPANMSVVAPAPAASGSGRSVAAVAASSTSGSPYTNPASLGSDPRSPAIRSPQQQQFISVELASWEVGNRAAAPLSPASIAGYAPAAAVEADTWGASDDASGDQQDWPVSLGAPAAAAAAASSEGWGTAGSRAHMRMAPAGPEYGSPEGWGSSSGAADVATAAAASPSSSRGSHWQGLGVSREAAQHHLADAAAQQAAAVRGIPGRVKGTASGWHRSSRAVHDTAASDAQQYEGW